MKRLLAILMVLIMPVCAAAETYKVSIDIAADENLFDKYLKEAVLLNSSEESAERIDTVVQLLRSILDGINLEITAQEDAAAVNVSLDGGILLDMAIHTTQDASFLTSSMLPGYVLVSQANDMEPEVSVQIDWDLLKAGVEKSVDRWLSDIEPTTMVGSFVGDAYDGGTRCTTWILADMDVAALVSALMTDEVRKAASLCLSELGDVGDSLLSSFDALNAKVADEDVHMYILRIVKNDADELVGASLTILREEVQIATISFGIEDNKTRFVIGLGLDAKNYWWEVTAGKSFVRDKICFTGISREWVADKDESFSYVCASATPVTDFEWYCYIQEIGAKYLWDAAVYEKDDSAAYAYLCTSSGSFAPVSKMLDFSWSLGGGSEKLLTINVNVDRTEAIAPLTDGLQRCLLTDPAYAEERERLIQQLSAAIAARLIKLLPMDLIFRLDMPSLPK